MPPVQLLARALVQSRINADLNLQRLMVDFEELLIDAVLDAMPSLRAAARALGISRSTLWRRLRRRDLPGADREKAAAISLSESSRFSRRDDELGIRDDEFE